MTARILPFRRLRVVPHVAIARALDDPPQVPNVEAGDGCVYLTFPTPSGELEFVLDIHDGAELRDQLDTALRVAGGELPSG